MRCSFTKLLRNKSFLVLYIGQFTSIIGDNLFSVALYWYILTISQYKHSVGILGIVQTSAEVFGLISGVFVDRWLKKKTMIVCDLLRAFLCLGLFFFTKLEFKSLVIFYILIFLLKLTSVFFSPANSAFLPEIVNKEDLASAVAYNKSSRALARFTGSSFGGVIYTLFGASVLFILNAFSFFVSMITIFLINVKEEKLKKVSKTNILEDWKEGISILFSKEILLKNILLATIMNLGLAPFQAVLTLFVKEQLQSNASILGFLTGIMCVGLFCGSILNPLLFKHIGYKRILILCPTLIGFCIGLMAIFPNKYLSFVLMFGVGLFLGFVNGTLPVIVLNYVPKDARGRVFGVLGATDSIFSPVGLFVITVLLINLPVNFLLLLISLTSILSGCVHLIPSKFFKTKIKTNPNEDVLAK